MLSERQVLAALGELIQLALSTARQPGLISEARISPGMIVIGVKDDGVTQYVNVMVEPVQESPRDMQESPHEAAAGYVHPSPGQAVRKSTNAAIEGIRRRASAPAEDPPEPPVGDPEGDTGSTGVPGAAEDVRNTTPAQAEELPGPSDTDPEGALKSTEALGAAQDVRDTTEDAGRPVHQVIGLGKIRPPQSPGAGRAVQDTTEDAGRPPTEGKTPDPQPPAASDTDDAAEDAAKE